MSVPDFKHIAGEVIDSLVSELTEVSLKIHSHPELAYKEVFAHDLLVEFLEKKDFSVEKHYLGLETSFRATFGKGSPTIAVLCEYDALPGIGHACGHNLIAVSGLAAGLAIRKAMEAGCPGSLVILGTPAEEAGGGKIDLIRHGAFESINAALMVHPSPADVVYGAPLAMQPVKVQFHGKPAHAAAFPWEGVNALDAVVSAYTNISHLRQQIKITDRIHGIITDGGQAHNIIPAHSSASYGVRSKSIADLEALKPRVENCFSAAALSTGCTVNIDWIDKPYFDVATNSVLAELYTKNMETLGVFFGTKDEQLKLPAGSTDFGNVSYIMPAIHPCFNIRPKGANHTQEFTEASSTPQAHEETWKAAKGIAYTAIDLFSNPEKMIEAKKAFDKI